MDNTARVERPATIPLSLAHLQEIAKLLKELSKVKSGEYASFAVSGTPELTARFEGDKDAQFAKSCFDLLRTSMSLLAFNSQAEVRSIISFKMPRRRLTAKAKDAIALIDKWLVEDQEEHAETLETISKSINESRKGYRRAF